MKFQPDRSETQTISAYGPGWIGVDGEKLTTSVILGSRGLRQAWDCTSFEDLTPAHFAQLAGLDAELILSAAARATAFRRPPGCSR